MMMMALNTQWRDIFLACGASLRLLKPKLDAELYKASYSRKPCLTLGNSSKAAYSYNAEFMVSFCTLMWENLYECRRFITEQEQYLIGLKSGPDHRSCFGLSAILYVCCVVGCLCRTANCNASTPDSVIGHMTCCIVMPSTCVVMSFALAPPTHWSFSHLQLCQSKCIS